jgi:hypothetical protein
MGKVYHPKILTCRELLMSLIYIPVAFHYDLVFNKEGGIHGKNTDDTGNLLGCREKHTGGGILQDLHPQGL